MSNGLDAIDHLASREGDAITMSSKYRTRRPRGGRASRGHGQNKPVDYGKTIDARVRRKKAKDKAVAKTKAEMYGGLKLEDLSPFMRELLGINK